MTNKDYFNTNAPLPPGLDVRRSVERSTTSNALWLTLSTSTTNRPIFSALLLESSEPKLLIVSALTKNIDTATPLSNGFLISTNEDPARTHLQTNVSKAKAASDPGPFNHTMTTPGGISSGVILLTQRSRLNLGVLS